MKWLEFLGPWCHYPIRKCWPHQHLVPSHPPKVHATWMSMQISKLLTWFIVHPWAPRMPNFSSSSGKLYPRTPVDLIFRQEKKKRKKERELLLCWKNLGQNMKYCIRMYCQLIMLWKNGLAHCRHQEVIVLTFWVLYQVWSRTTVIESRLELPVWCLAIHIC